MTLSDALSQSVNSVAVQISERVGRQIVTDTARRLGIKSNLTSHASLSLGTSEVTLLELTSAYAPFANGGFKADPFGLLRIETRGGYVLYEKPKQAQKSVVALSHVAAMNVMLGQAMRQGTGKRAYLSGRASGGKTGTSQESRDALFVGYTADYVTGVWVGNDDSKPMKNVTGGRVPTIIWKDFMLAVHRGLPAKELPGAHLSMAVAQTEESDSGSSGFLTRLWNGFGQDSANAASQ
jgi:penicillin-binding protein 1A